MAPRFAALSAHSVKVSLVHYHIPGCADRALVKWGVCVCVCVCGLCVRACVHACVYVCV